MTHEQLEAIRKRVSLATSGDWYTEITTFGDRKYVHVQPGIAQDSNVADAEFIAHAREDIPALLAEVERLRREISFIAHVDLLKNAYNAEHIAVSVQSWALNVLDGINHDGK